MIVTGSSDTNIRIWDPKTGKNIKTLDGHTHTVLCVVELESGFLASGSLDQTAIVWNPNTGKIVNMLEGFENPIIGMIELDKKQMVINFNEPILLTWAWISSSNSNSNSKTHSLGESPLTCVTKLSGTELLCGCEDGNIYLLNTEKDKVIHQYSKHTDVVFAIELISESRFLSNSTDQNIILWDIKSGDVLKTINIASDMVMSMHYDKPQDLLIFSSLDGKVRAVELSPEIVDVKAKYEIDQGSPIFSCEVIGFQEIRLLKEKVEKASTKEVHQVIVEESKDEDSPSKEAYEPPPTADKEAREEISSKDVRMSKKNVSDSASGLRIHQNQGIERQISGHKKQLKINGLFDINKTVLDDPEADESYKKGKFFVIATVRQEDNCILLWDISGKKL